MFLIFLHPFSVLRRFVLQARVHGDVYKRQVLIGRGLDLEKPKAFKETQILVFSFEGAFKRA